MGTKSVWFGSWKCNCTVLAGSSAAISDSCPDHGKDLLYGPCGPREFVSVDADAPMGIQADHRLVVSA